MAYGNEDYRDFHYKSWKNLSNEQQGFFGGDRNAYRQYKEDHGLDGFKSAKDKAQTYQYDKQWKDLDDEYKAMHTHEQHKAARDEWQAGKGMDWDSTSDAYKMMIDKNLHSSWYQPPSTNSGAPDPFNDNRNSGGNGPIAPGADPNPPVNPITHPGNGSQGNGPTPDNTYGAKPVKQPGEKTADYRARVDDWKAGQESSNPSPTPPSSSGGNSDKDRWSYEDPTLFWDKHTDGVAWEDLKKGDKKQYGEWGQLGYMSGAMGWENYNNMSGRLQDEWEKIGGRDAYQDARDFYNTYDSGSGSSTDGGGSSGGSPGTGSGPSTIVIENGNSGGESLTFDQQQQLAQDQRAWQEGQNELARAEAQADREEARKEARIQTIIAGMNAAKNGNSWANQGGGRGPIWGGSGYSRGTRQGFTPWR